MATTIINLKESCESSLKHYENAVAEIEIGTYKFDGSMPESCIVALNNKKVAVYKQALDYLSQFPDDLEVVSRYGYGKEYAGYLEIVNQ